LPEWRCCSWPLPSLRSPPTLTQTMVSDLFNYYHAFIFPKVNHNSEVFFLLLITSASKKLCCSICFAFSAISACFETSLLRCCGNPDAF
jgi:hypothetical protein